MDQRRNITDKEGTQQAKTGNGGLLVVLGAGESGVGAAYLARQKGYEVFVSDFGAIADHYKGQLVSWGIRFEENGHTETEIFKATQVVKSPGIPNKAPIVKRLRVAGIPVISRIEDAGRLSEAIMVF